MTAVRRATAATAAAAVLVAVAAAFVPALRLNVVARWNIYASATGSASDPYTVFLGPFPTRFSCEVEARIIVRSGGHAFCRGDRALEIGTARQDLLWAEFWPAARWIAVCRSFVARAPRASAPRADVRSAN